MPRILRMRAHQPEESILVRAATLATILVAVAAVAVQQEELSRQAILAAVAIGLGSWFSYHRRHANNWWVKVIITVLVLAVTQAFFRGLFENPYDPRLPLIQLFLWLQALHSFDLPARKDLKYALTSAVVLMAVAAVFARDLTFGMFLVAFSLVASVAMVAMRERPFRLKAPVAIAVGLLLGFGVLLAGAVTFVVIPHEQGLRARWMPMSAGLALSLRLHERIINPAYPEVLGTDPERSPPAFNPNSYVGFSTYVDLRLRGILSDTLVMRVRTTRAGFWRGLAFDEYTGRGWRMRERGVEEYFADGGRIVPRFSPDDPWPAGSEQVIQTFYVEAAQPNVIFAAYRPFEVFFPVGSLGVDRYAGLRSPIPLEKGMIYSVISRVPNPTPRQLRRRDEEDDPGEIRARYLQLPAIPERVRRLADQLTAGLGSPYEKAVAINQFLVRIYTYNLQAPVLPDGADAVDSFLFVSKQGACETFASALTVLLRAVGVPARVVTGYTSGQYNILTGYYEVRNSDAHAWVEAFLPRVGWIEFEPTPGFDAPEAFAGGSAGRWLARDAGVWLLRSLQVASRPVLASLGNLHVLGLNGTSLSTGAVAVLVMMLLLVRHRTLGTDDGFGREGIEDAYKSMIKALARAGIARHPTSTPREFAVSTPSQVRPFAGAVTDVFEEHRYGQRRIPPEREVQTRQALARLQEALGRRGTGGGR